MKMKTPFVIRKGYTESLWDDGAKPILDKIGGEIEITRASHVDPINRPSLTAWLNPLKWVENWGTLQFIKSHGLNCFGIFWKGDVKQWGLTFFDGEGNTFNTKSAAVEYEVKCLKIRHLGL